MRAWIAALALAAGCASGDPRPEGPPPRSLPPGWLEAEPLAFERLLAEELPGPDPVAFDAASLATLAEVLDRMDVSSVRAALLLAHSRHPSSAELILERLEKREEAPTRAGDGGDVVAAVALAGFPDTTGFAARLATLAVGERAHPDLDVRVECAGTLLALGDDAPVPFLLKVLRIDTWAGQRDERDFATSPHTAWARGRAADALCRRAGVPRRYQPDGSIESREREADRLERLLLPGDS